MMSCLKPSTINKEKAARSYAKLSKSEIEDFLQVTALKSLQFAKHSAHWIESIFWIVLLAGATGFAIRDVRKVCVEFANEETFTRLAVIGFQRLTFDDAIICVQYDPRALNLADQRLIRHANLSQITPQLARGANTSEVKLLNRILKLLTAISLVEHGRTVDYEKKLRELQRDDDLQQLHDWLRTQEVDISDLQREVGNWLCNAFGIRIDTMNRGTLFSSATPCTASRITWLGVVPFGSYILTECALCVNISNHISFGSMFDRVVISFNTNGLFQGLPTNESTEQYPLYSYVDFSGNPVSTEMTRDYIAFPESRSCLAFGIGISATLRLLDRRVDRCNVTAKTRLGCYADCAMHDFENTTMANCTQLSWRYLYAENRTMCFDVLTIDEHFDSRHRRSRINVTAPCYASCLYPCEYRQYDFFQDPEGCYGDDPNVGNGVALELTPRRFRVPVFEEHFSPTISELFSRIGGTCGLWLGVGLLGICHVLLFPLKLLMKLLLQARGSMESNTASN